MAFHPTPLVHAHPVAPAIDPPHSSQLLLYPTLPVPLLTPPPQVPPRSPLRPPPKAKSDSHLKTPPAGVSKTGSSSGTSSGHLTSSPPAHIRSSVVGRRRASDPGPRNSRFDLLDSRPYKAREATSPQHSYLHHRPPPEVRSTTSDSINSLDPSAAMPSLPSPPEVRVTKPSLPPASAGVPGPTSVASADLAHPFAAVVSMIEAGATPHGHSFRSKGKARSHGERPEEGRAQTIRRVLVGPTGVISRIASKTSLSSISRKVSAGRFLHPGTPTSASFLRPAPHSPQAPSTTRFAASSARHPSPSPLDLSAGYASVLQEDMIEIPRFKKRELNLGIVNKRGPWKLIWLLLWAWWIFNGLLSLFFDANVIFILVQCVIHPSSSANSSKSWTFATVAYAVCWGMSTFVVWIGWELGYEFWRRWRLSRPAIEPIYLSLPASLHLALSDYNYFIFLAYIRLSSWDTAHAADIFPEACYALLQLGPGLVALLPRAAIAIVAVISFSSPQKATTFGSVDDSQFRDPHFFRSDEPGVLTGYAKTVCLAFASYVGLRLILVLVSVVGLWSFSGKPFGGLFPRSAPGASPTTPRRPKSSLPLRDPNKTASPQKSWLSAEIEFDWSWRDRTRARIQDAFELCMIRKDHPSSWDSRSPSTMPMEQHLTPTRPTQSGDPISASDFLAQFVGHLPSSTQGQASPPLDHIQALSTPRPESTVLPQSSSEEVRPLASHPPVSRGISDFSNVSSSSHDDFYTPQVTPTPSRSEVKQERPLSHESEESLVDDSAALIPSSSASSSRDRSGSISTHGVSSRSSSLRRRDPGHSTGERALSRARSTSVGLLRDSLANANGIVKRARSGTILSTDSGYERMDQRDQLESPLSLDAVASSA